MATRFQWDDFVLDLDTYRLEHRGAPVALEPKALNLLALMVQRPGHAFSKQELFDAVWTNTAVTDHALTRVIAQLRRALGDEAREARYIETVPTRGYRWIPVARTPPVDTPAPPSTPLPLAMRPRETARRPWLLAVAGVTTLAALTAGFLATVGDWPGVISTSATAAADSWRPTEGRDPVWPVQLTTHDGLDMHPSLSPAGDAVAFASDRTGAFEIFVRDLSGTGSEMAVTSGGGQQVQPAWSPDGRWLAFHSGRDGGIFVVPARGGVPRQVAPAGSHPAWSPDGRRLAFQSDEFTDATPSAHGAQAGSTLWIVDVDGSHLRPVTRLGRPGGGHGVPAWSHDGRWLAFVVFDGGDDDGLWVLDTSTEAVRRLDEGRGIYEVAFAADDAAIYGAGGGPALVRLPFDAASGTPRGGAHLLPVPGVASVRGLSVALDGRRVAFAGLALDSQIWAQPLADGRPRGAPRALTTDTSRRKSLATVSPDGARVAYMSSRRGDPPNVWVMDIDGRHPRQLTDDHSAEAEPAWYPDSRRIAHLRVTQDGVRSLDVVDATTRLTTRLAEVSALARSVPAGTTRPSGPLAGLRFSPSMTVVAFEVKTPPFGLRRVFVTGLDRYYPRALSDGEVWTGYPAWSPDEQRLAVEVKEGSSTWPAVIDVRTGALTRLPAPRGHTWVRSWSPDGRRIAAAVLRRGSWSLRAIAADGSGDDELVPPVPPNVYVRYPDWSPRGDIIVFERGELRGNIWTLALD